MSADEEYRSSDIAVALLLASGYGAPFSLAAALVSQSIVPFALPVAALVTLILCTWATLQIVRRSRASAWLASRWLVLVILPLWGLGYNHFLGNAECSSRLNALDLTAFRPFAEPEVLGLIVMHALTVGAYAISRRRPEALRPWSEALIHATLIAGVVVQLVIAVHIAKWLLAGILLAPLLLPCVAPLLTVFLFAAELHARLARRGAEALVAGSLAAPILGAYAVIQALWHGSSDGAMRVFTRTCGHVFSTIDIVILPGGHYLCTVAARGHVWLVQPQRIGARGGVAIVVNRQLAVANAFEDLLHERWPRFARLARRIYDRLAWPLSRYIQNPWLADLVYLAMKPAEWIFALSLLLLDRSNPEQRVERMYR